MAVYVSDPDHRTVIGSRWPVMTTVGDDQIASIVAELHAMRADPQAD